VQPGREGPASAYWTTSVSASSNGRRSFGMTTSGRISPPAWLHRPFQIPEESTRGAGAEGIPDQESRRVEDFILGVGVEDDLLRKVGV
jgi:hypothetical protein